MAIVTERPNRFDPTGQDLEAGQSSEMKFKNSILEMNKNFPPGTYFEVKDTLKSEDTDQHIDWWVLKYVDNKLSWRKSIQVKNKSAIKFCVAEIRRGNENEGWLLSGKMDLIAEEKNDKFFCYTLNMLKQKTVEMFGTDVLVDLPTLKDRFPYTDSSDEAQWGTMKISGFEPMLHFKRTTYRNKSSEDVLAYVLTKSFKKGEYFEIEAV